jgi:CRP/FNR family cyclic AMP-dependent transcriptional regulator
MGPVEGPPAIRRTVRLLDYDPELGATLSPERLAKAHESAQATLVEVARGARSGAELTGGHQAAYGVLLLDGLANRTVVLDGVVSAQLLGRGDLVRVGSESEEALVPTAIGWTVLEPLTAALLDERFLLTVRRWPELVAALFERVAAQEERREIHRALSQLPRVEDRVHVLLWLLAERWGRVTRQGVILRLRLTHELIGQLVGAKRPTVSLALKQLEERGAVHRRADGSWLLEQVAARCAFWVSRSREVLQPANRPPKDRPQRSRDRLMHPALRSPSPKGRVVPPAGLPWEYAHAATDEGGQHQK